MNVCLKVGRRCRMMRVIPAKEYGRERSTLRMLFSAARQPWLAQEGFDELEKVQVKAIRLISGQLVTTQERPYCWI